ncbi:MAG: ThiF family adenylyltransferase [Candidatus Thiodiazotropha lotti]|nr:ThiF family adenylyltransferase [Candidatus Thiodiazotropha lotti]MCW4218623.1 ThiF family adenylyltransferase [Candidatus Thiodiazotropha lotti]
MALERQLPGRWRRVTFSALSKYANVLTPSAGWAITLPPGIVAAPDVDHLLVIIDTIFPDSQPRVIAPHVVEDGSWPHVEGNGMLCLESTRIGFDAGERILQHISWAIDLLNFDEATRKKEFQREFGIYWRRSCAVKPTLTAYSLIRPTGPSREVFYFFDWSNATITFADDLRLLSAWLRNKGNNPGQKEIKKTWLTWLDQPPYPANFPQIGKDILEDIPDAVLAKTLKPGKRLPVILGTETETGPVIVGSMVDSAPKKEVIRGFRPNRVPIERITHLMAYRPIRRFPVQRADGAYVHGRGHNEDYEKLATKTVAIVGCGALGASIARLLAQAGVSSFILIDHDKLETQNTSRHLLGHRFVGQYKSDALAAMLLEDFPHLQDITAHKYSCEHLLSSCMEKLSSCDLILSAGIDFVGDSALNRWRLASKESPPHLCTWTEPFALAGHAIALFGLDDLMDAFDIDGKPRIELTQWNNDKQILITEAGCGNSFQPHGSVDLQRTITLASKLALDMLTGTLSTPTRRTWQGDLSQVLHLGGKPSLDFTDSNVEKTHSWPPSPPNESQGSKT